jgi:hypothetical protein
MYLNTKTANPEPPVENTPVQASVIRLLIWFMIQGIQL